MPFIKLKVAFQAKRYGQDTPIRAPAIRDFKGGVIGRFDRGIFITTSNFTRGAIEEADQPGMTIVLMDGRSLVQHMIDLGLGVKTIPVVTQEVSEDFFKGLSR
jgi:restriction system protein